MAEISLEIAEDWKMRQSFIGPPSPELFDTMRRMRSFRRTARFFDDLFYYQRNADRVFGSESPYDSFTFVRSALGIANYDIHQFFVRLNDLIEPTFLTLPGSNGDLSVIYVHPIGLRPRPDYIIFSIKNESIALRMKTDDDSIIVNKDGRVLFAYKGAEFEDLGAIEMAGAINSRAIGSGPGRRFLSGLRSETSGLSYYRVTRTGQGFVDQFAAGFTLPAILIFLLLIIEVCVVWMLAKINYRPIRDLADQISMWPRLEEVETSNELALIGATLTIEHREYIELLKGEFLRIITRGTGTTKNEFSKRAVQIGIQSIGYRLRIGIAFSTDVLAGLQPSYIENIFLKFLPTGCGIIAALSESPGRIILAVSNPETLAENAIIIGLREAVHQTDRLKIAIGEPRAVDISVHESYIEAAATLESARMEKEERFLEYAELSKRRGTRKESDLEQLDAYIAAHYADRDFSVGAAAESVGMSLSAAGRLFSYHRGTSIQEYVSDLRIKKALRLLEEGRTIKETIYEVGYTDASSFIRKFKAVTGMTPGKYARKP